MNKKTSSVFPLFILISIMIFAAACHTTKKVTENKPAASLEGKDISASNLEEAIQAHHLDYETLSSRLKVDYKHENKSFSNVSILLRMKKGEAIWASIRPILGVEVYRVLITPDSIKMKDNLKNKIITKNTSETIKDLPIPFDFATLENILLGNPVLENGKVSGFEHSGDKITAVLDNQSVKGIYEWEATPFQLLKSIFELDRNRKATQEFEEYEDSSIGSFSTKRRLQVQDKGSTTLDITFAKTVFDEEDLEFPFPRQ